MKCFRNKIKIIFIFIFINLISFNAINVHAQQPSITATLRAIPPSYSGECPTTIKFEGEIIVKNIKSPIKVQYRFIRSDGATSGHPITLNFEKDGSIKVSSAWMLGKDYKGWQAIKIIYPQQVESNKANFEIQCRSDGKPDIQKIKHDLAIKIDCILNWLVIAGQFLDSKQFKVTATNHGEEVVNDVIVDLVLRNDPSCPVPTPYSVYSPKYSNGVLLLGGRERISLNPGQTRDMIFAKPIKIPVDTPTGWYQKEYYLCAVIDAGNRVLESNEQNNCACCPIKIRPLMFITGFKEKCIEERGNLTILGKNFGTKEDKSVVLFQPGGAHLNMTVISWSDTEIVAKVPPYHYVGGITWYVGIKYNDSNYWLSNTENTQIAICRKN